MTRTFIALLGIPAALALASCSAGSGDTNDSRGAADTAAMHAPPAPDDTAHAAGAWSARFDGVGPLREGMTPAQVRAAVTLPEGARLEGDSCVYLRLPDPRVNLMMVGGTLARVDVRDTTVRTADGARVLQPVDSVKALYAGRMQEQPHKYSRGWSYLIVDAPSDTTHRLVFESDGNRVVSYRVGRRPPVDWVEGCS